MRIPMSLCGLVLAACQQESEQGSLTESSSLSDMLQEYQGGSHFFSVGYPIPGGFDAYNKPARLDNDFMLRVSDLPLAGGLDKIPWSGSCWPIEQGGLAYRWRTPLIQADDFLTPEQIIDASPSELEKLSPAEKYDIFAGSYSLPFTNWVVGQNQNNDQDVDDYCHGWVVASDSYQEPRHVMVENEDGVQIPFGSSDIKALLTYFRAAVVTSHDLPDSLRADNRVLGSPCVTGKPTDPSCYDSNPGAFHVVLSNRLGRQKYGLYMDLDNSEEEQIVAVHGYRANQLEKRLPSPGASPYAVNEYVFQTEIWGNQEISPRWTPVLGSGAQQTSWQTYLYTVEVDRNDEVVGGQWVIRLDDGYYLTMNEAWSYLTQVGDNEDGRPDMSTEEISKTIWNCYIYPDYLWIQNNVSFAAHFVDAISFEQAETVPAEMFDYFGRMEELYLLSIAQ